MGRECGLRAGISFDSNFISSLFAKLQLSGETECALILDERGPSAAIRNRTRKLFFPFLQTMDLKVFVVLDICHMLKLARNALGDMKSFVTYSGDKVSWEALYDIQLRDILYIGNKIKTKHIQ